MHLAGVSWLFTDRCCLLYGCLWPQHTVDAHQGLNQLSASERAQEMERYLLQPSRVVQAQQEQGLQPGTPAALEALTKEFFLGHDVGGDQA